MRTFATLFLLFVGLISSSAQFYTHKSEQEIWEEEQKTKNNYDEYLTKHAYVYDEEEGRELAAKKKETLKKALEFYDSQISIVERWIEKRKVTANKFNTEIPLNYETMKYVILIKMLILNKYEKNLSEKTLELLNNKELCNKIKEKGKANKDFLPVLESYIIRMNKEKQSIEQILNETTDSTIIKFDASTKSMLGLLYLDINDIYCTNIAYNRFKVLNEINVLPQKWGTIQYKNPNYNPAEGEWAWIHAQEWDNVRSTYPIEEEYRRYKDKPDYKVKDIEDRLVALKEDSCEYIEKKEKDNYYELRRQICIDDYKNNKYNIKASSPSILSKIDEMLVEGHDRKFYVVAELTYNMAKKAYEMIEKAGNTSSLQGMLLARAGLAVPRASEKEKEEFKQKMKELAYCCNKVEEIDSNPEYKTAEKYINQLMADRENISFTSKRKDGLSYIYTSSDGKYKILMTMKFNGKSISESYSLINK